VAIENIIATAIVDSAYKIHKAIGPGLLESSYELPPREEIEALLDVTQGLLLRIRSIVTEC